MEDWKNLVIKITETEHRRIKTMAAEKGVSIKQLILDGVEEAKDKYTSQSLHSSAIRENRNGNRT